MYIYGSPSKLIQMLSVFTSECIFLWSGKKPKDYLQVESFQSLCFFFIWKNKCVHLWVSSEFYCMYTCMLSRVQLFVTPWAVARQAPLSMGFPRQEYWRELPFPSPADLPSPGIEPPSPASPTWADGFFISEPPRKPLLKNTLCLKCYLFFKQIDMWLL